MPGCRRLIIDNACYHIMVRGNQKQKIFKNEDDMDVYIKLMIRYKKRFKIKLYGYCLMPNHVHIICQTCNKKSLPKFMQGLNRSYTAYFNGKFKKVGHLWQGRFKSKIIAMDKYLIDCMSYVEYNPVRSGIVKNPQKYNWSSYNERNMLNSSYNILDQIVI